MSLNIYSHNIHSMHFQYTHSLHTQYMSNTLFSHSLLPPPAHSVHTTAMRSVDRMVTLSLQQRSGGSEGSEGSKGSKGSEGSEGVGLTSATCATLLTRVTRFFTHAKTLTRTSAFSCASGLVLLCRASLTEEQVRVIVPGPLRLSRLEVTD